MLDVKLQEPHLISAQPEAPEPESQAEEDAGPEKEDLKVLESLAWRPEEARTREDDIDDYLRDLFV